MTRRSISLEAFDHHPANAVLTTHNIGASNGGSKQNTCDQHQPYGTIKPISQYFTFFFNKPRLPCAFLSVNCSDQNYMKVHFTKPNFQRSVLTEWSKGGPITKFFCPNPSNIDYLQNCFNCILCNKAALIKVITKDVATSQKLC